MKTLKHVIFDFDGTLIDSAPSILSSFGAAFAALGLTPVRPLDHALIGPPLPRTLEMLAGSSDPELIERLSVEFKRIYAVTGLPQTVAYPGAGEALQRLGDAGLTLHLGTNKRAEPALRLLDMFDWRHHFTSVYCIDSHPGRYGNKGDMLRLLLVENAITPSQAIYLGDTQGDQTAAAFATLDFIAAAWGYGDWTDAATPRFTTLDATVDALLTGSNRPTV